jgi:hypothetical protein
MHPRQMRDTVIPVLPSFVYSILSPARVKDVFPGAAQARTNYLSEAPEPKRNAKTKSRYQRGLSSARDTRSCSILPTRSLLILVPYAAEPYAAA